MTDPSYVTDDAAGTDWRMMLGDSCERLAELNDSSVDLSVYSPPFAALYVYSPSPRDLGNSRTTEEFFTHYAFIVREVLRVTKPGRVACVHVANVPLRKNVDGYVGLYDFRGDVIRAHLAQGWIFHGEVTVDKDPQAQAIRTKAQALMFATKNRDSAKLRPALADYLLVFRKPGDNDIPVDTDVSNDEWIAWARPIWKGSTDEDAIASMESLGLALPRTGWYDVKETGTLNERAGREAADERHVCPLQLDFIERCIRLYSNPRELVLSPFAGIGSEGYVALKHDRRFVGCELKGSYWRTAVANLQQAEREVGMATLFPDEAIA